MIQKRPKPRKTGRIVLALAGVACFFVLTADVTGGKAQYSGQLTGNKTSFWRTILPTCKPLVFPAKNGFE